MFSFCSRLSGCAVTQMNVCEIISFFPLTLCFSLLQYRCDNDGGTYLQVCGTAGKSNPSQGCSQSESLA